MHIGKILEQINNFINDNSQLNEAIKKISDSDKKLVVLNNSFLYREKIKTNKNEKYLAFIPKQLPLTEKDCFVVTGPNLKSDYSIQSSVASKISLKEAIAEELKSLGDIVFVLMGEIDESIEIPKEIDHELIKKVIFSPKETDLIRINNDEIILKSLDDEERNWNSIEEQLKNNSSFNSSLIDDLKQKIGKVFDDLKKEAYLNLLIPNKFGESKKYFLEAILESIKDQYNLYNNAITEMSKATTDRKNYFNEVLRISYNFVDDASTLIRLLISVCDLKPLVFWQTFYFQYKLNESIRLLPWTRQDTKPSLSKYIETIKKARNKSFHRLIPFSKAFEIKLPENSIKSASLRIFSEYGSKNNSNRLEYEDKELVEVLMEFTRTSEEVVSDNFWQKNANVIENTIELLNITALTIRNLK